MPRVAVAKMHGARNDFVVLDHRAHPVDDLVAFAIAVCDRHSGIGSDGLLAIGTRPGAPLTMRVINSDGSEAEMCGNGVRCVAAFLDAAGEGEDQRIETLGGTIETHVVSRGREYRVRVNVGTPRMETPGGPETTLAVVSVGNRHLVHFVNNIDSVDLEREAREYTRRFPEGINAHAAAVDGLHEMRARHYERGAGYTMACGTGTVACVAAAMARGDVSSPVTVHVPGGELEVEWDGRGSAFLTGPAMRVFDTEIDVLPATQPV